MMMMALSLALVAAAIEIMLVSKFPILLFQVQRHILVGVCFSMALSWGLGAVFGASGMTMLFAATASTIITVAVYKLRLVGMALVAYNKMRELAPARG